MPVITRWGHAFFSIHSDGGAHLATDPYDQQVGYAMPALPPAEAVSVSHEHSDHNNLTAVPGKPEVIRGLTAQGHASVDRRVGDFRLRAVATFHDEQRGAQRGRNAVFLIEVDGLSIVHCGDLGHVLAADQCRQIGKVDVLLVPVGGHYTIDAAAATKVVQQLAPRITIPMHYKTPATRRDSPIAEATAFLAGKNVRRCEAENRLSVSAGDLPAAPETVVLGYSA